jgi:hypothetical protein
LEFTTEMSSGSSGYDPKYTSLDPSARADGKRYHVTRQEQQQKKKGKEQKKGDTPLKNPKASSTNSKAETSIAKVGPR